MQRKQKIEKLIMIKVSTREKARIIIDNEKQDTFQFVSVWLRFWRCFINPCIFE